MKIILCLIAATALLCGCQPEKPTQENAIANTNSLASTATNVVTGGFGFVLGDILPADQDTFIETNSRFHYIIINILTNRQICSIQAQTDKGRSLQDVEMRGLLKGLSDKYGFLVDYRNAEGAHYVFGDLEASCMVVDDAITTYILYSSKKLNDEFKKLELNKAREKFSGL